MIYLQFKRNSLKIGPSVPSISLNYGRNLAKRPNDGSGNGNSSRLFVQCGKEYMHFQTEILRNHGNYIEIKMKTKTNTNKRIKHTKLITRRLCIDEIRNTAI